MNVRPAIEEAHTPAVLSVAFNNDASCFSVGLESGICIFHTKSCLLKASRDFNAGIGLVQMMGTTNYLGLVGGGRSPKFASNKAIIWDDAQGKVAVEISALTPVRGLQLARNRIVVVLQNSVRVYSFAKPPDLVSRYETADNPYGLAALSDRHIVFPGRTPGHLQIVEIASGNVTIVPASSSAVRALAISPDGALVATASETGTLIRVFSAASGARVAELRRGIDPAAVFGLAFSPSGSLLACTSDKATLHVFDLPRKGGGGGGGATVSSGSSASSTTLRPSGAAATVDDGRGRWGILGKIPLMPRMFSDVYSFASAPFEAGDEPLIGGLPVSGSTTLGTTRPPKGVIGWLSENSLVVVGAGRDARWEKFVLAEGEDGRRVCFREGWKRYLGAT